MATTCITGKRVYSSETLAEDALIEAATRHGEGSGGPVAVYLCHDCANYHLTSKGQMNTRLEQYIRDGKLKLNHEANRWLKKFK